MVQVSCHARKRLRERSGRKGVDYRRWAKEAWASGLRLRSRGRLSLSLFKSARRHDGLVWIFRPTGFLVTVLEEGED